MHKITENETQIPENPKIQPDIDVSESDYMQLYPGSKFSSEGKKESQSTVVIEKKVNIYPKWDKNAGNQRKLGSNS